MILLTICYFVKFYPLYVEKLSEKKKIPLWKILSSTVISGHTIGFFHWKYSYTEFLKPVVLLHFENASKSFLSPNSKSPCFTIIFFWHLFIYHFLENLFFFPSSKNFSFTIFFFALNSLIFLLSKYISFTIFSFQKTFLLPHLCIGNSLLLPYFNKRKTYLLLL